jgi:hypothetical protein
MQIKLFRQNDETINLFSINQSRNLAYMYLLFHQICVQVIIIQVELYTPMILVNLWNKSQRKKGQNWYARLCDDKKKAAYL